MRTLCALLLLIVGCPAGEPGVELLSDDLDGGVLLSAWSDGASLRMAGGHLGNGTGTLALLEGDVLCTEQDVTERALWWIHGSREGEWYAVGEAGTVLHEVDGVRTREDLPTDVTLFGVYDDGDAVWAVGGSFAGTAHGEVWVRRDGTWSAVDEALPAVVFKVWDGWFVGDGAAWRLGEGDALQPLDLGGEKLLTVRGRGDDDVWAVGGYGQPAVMRGGASGWEPVSTEPMTQALNGVWTAPGERVWVAGMRGLTAWTDDGESWEQPELAVTTKDFHAAWKHGEHVYFVGGDLLSTTDPRGAIARWGIPGGEIEVLPCP